MHIKNININFVANLKLKIMPAHKKEIRMIDIPARISEQMNSDLLSLESQNMGLSRNELIRIACDFLLKNPKKFNLVKK